MMIDKFSVSNITFKQAKEDANTSIILTALSLAPSNETIVVIEEGVDILLIFIVLCRNDKKILKPQKAILSPVTFSPTNAVSSKCRKRSLAACYEGLR